VTLEAKFDKGKAIFTQKLTEKAKNLGKGRKKGAPPETPFSKLWTVRKKKAAKRGACYRSE